jgi:hypothetical protein
VRISLGGDNTAQEIDTLGDAVAAIAAGRIRGEYFLKRSSGEYLPTRMNDDFSGYLGT